MANIAVAFGFKHIGYVEGAAPTYGLRRRKIALGQTNPIFRGDPVSEVAGPTGYIQQAAAGTISLTGVFSHCEYFSVSQQRKVRSNYWPGSDAQFDPDAFILDTVGSLFLAASSNGGPITFASTDRNINFAIATGGSATPSAGQGNTVAQLSGSTLDFGTISTTPTLPFRIYKLYSDDVVPGAPNAGATSPNGADNTTAFNWAVVTFNNVAFKQLTSL